MKQYADDSIFGVVRDGVWSIYIPAPEVKRWRIKRIEIDGKQGIEVIIRMNCHELKHGPYHNLCKMCAQRHELPKETDRRYAYRWYPMLPSVMAIMQWKRRLWEKGLELEYY